MKCKDKHKKISAYLDGQISGEEKHKLENHLNVCGHCRQVFLEMQSLNEMMGNLKVDESNSYAYTRFQAALSSRQRKSNKLEKWVAASALSFSLILGILFGNLTGVLDANQTIEGEMAMDASTYLTTLNDFPESSFSSLYFDVMQNREGGQL